ncbi:MAG: diadenylate cyclase [Nanoarchaeota archaeon]
MTKKIQEIEKIIIKIAIEIAKHGEGALFVIGNKVDYDRLMTKRFGKLSVFDKGAEKILKGLAVIDGAIIINTKGQLVDYGAMIKKTRAFIGFGTRHSAAMTSSKNGNISILASEEERKVKIFKNGRYIMQIDALQKNVEQEVSGISQLLESTGAGVIGTIGTVALAPTLGITLIPGIIIFGGSYYAIKSLVDKFQK